MTTATIPLPTFSNLQNGCSGFLYCSAKWAYQVVPFFWSGMIMAFMIVLFMASQRFGTARPGSNNR